jgi:hypothetical protein
MYRYLRTVKSWPLLIGFPLLVLLRHELECLNVVFLRAQQGHRDAVLTRATMRRRRIVAIESGM